jgi:hypothetical protein
MYIQVVNGAVNLIGGAGVGLPLPQEYLDKNPNVLNLPAENYMELPQIGDRYDPEADTFVPGN